MKKFLLSLALLSMVIAQGEAAPNRVCDYTQANGTRAGFVDCTEEVAALYARAIVHATVSGGPNALTLTSSPAVAAYVDAPIIAWTTTAANTAAMTANLDGLGAVAINSRTDAALASGDAPAGSYLGYYDGNSIRILTFTGAAGGGGVSDGDKGDITVSGGGATWSVDPDSVALTTDTTGSYAAGDAEAGAALTGDSATSFFAAGALEVARGGNGAAPGGDDQTLVSSSASAGTWLTIPDSEAAGVILGYDQATNAFSTKTDDDVPEAGDFAALDTSAEIRAILTDETGTGAMMFGLTTAMADELGCTGSQVVRRNAGDTAFECATAGGLATADIDTSAELRAIIGDEVGTGAAMFGLAASMADDLGCTGSQLVRRNAGDTAFECASAGGGFGDVVGPASAVDNAITRFDTATGKLIQNSDVLLSDGNEIDLPLQSSPTAPAADRLKLFAGKRGGRMLPKIMGASGLDTFLQPSLGFKAIAAWQPAGNSTTISAIGAAALSATGTATASNVATTNLHTMMRRLDYLVTTAASTAVAGFRSTVALFLVGGPAAEQGGFYYSCRWGPATGVSTATNRAFVGMGSATAAPSDVEPSSIANIMGMGWDAADTNIQMMHRGAAAVTKIDLGASFPVPTADRTKVYEITMFSPPGTTQSVAYEVRELGTSNVATGTISTNMPTNSTFLAPRGWMSVGGTSSVIGITLMNLYIETDF